MACLLIFSIVLFIFFTLLFLFYKKDCEEEMKKVEETPKYKGIAHIKMKDGQELTVTRKDYYFYCYGGAYLEKGVDTVNSYLNNSARLFFVDDDGINHLKSDIDTYYVEQALDTLGG